jgi:hypothetical protein
VTIIKVDTPTTPTEDQVDVTYRQATFDQIYGLRSNAASFCYQPIKVACQNSQVGLFFISYLFPIIWKKRSRKCNVSDSQDGWCGQDSNLHQSSCNSSALPLSYPCQPSIAFNTIHSLDFHFYSLSMLTWLLAIPGPEPLRGRTTAYFSSWA